MERMQYYPLRERTLELPVFFPSVSSVKSSRKPIEYAGILRAFQDLTGQYLVSAFDVDSSDQSSEFAELANKSWLAGSVLLLDSGNYEAYWLKRMAAWNQERFHQVAEGISAPLTFSFDNQAPSSDSVTNVQSTVSSWRRDQLAIPSTTIVPIVHGSTEDLPQLVTGVAQGTGVSYIAVAERELGTTMTERCLAIRMIRAQLNTLGHYIVLHILGTGNPISMALYAFEGADSFDGLEWCQNVVDHGNGSLHHFSHSEFHLLNSKWADIAAPQFVRAIAHNLEYFSSWVEAMREARRNQSEVLFLHQRLPAAVHGHLTKTLNWVAK